MAEHAHMQLSVRDSFKWIGRHSAWKSEKAMAPHSSTLAWKIPWMEEPGGLQSMGLLGSEWLHFHFLLSCIGEGNGNPLQCSCLENPRDWGAWWAAVYGIAQSRTCLKRLSSSSTQEAHPHSVLSSQCEYENIFQKRREWFRKKHIFTWTHFGKLFHLT